jgi:adenylate kinase family enzyme
VRRVSVVGNSGSGKSTVAAALAVRLGVAHVELDALKHQANWVQLPPPEFAARVRAALTADGWVVDGNYSDVRDEVWQRADTVIWVDPSRPVLMRQLVGRTLRRAILRTELWNGNREPWRNFFRLDPQESVIAWAWTKHRHYRELYAAALTEPRWAHLAFHRLRSRLDTERLLSSVQPRHWPERAG